MRYDRVIWDFNGTILDDVAVSIASTDELLIRNSLPPVKTVEKYYSVFGFPIIDYYKRLGFDFTVTDYSDLAEEWVKIYLNNVKNARLRDGVEIVLRHIKSKGIKQTILSMSESFMLNEQVKNLGITDYFDEIIGKDDILASGKLSLAEQWRNSHSDKNILYIGDTSHDVQSAEIIGAECILIKDGHESYESKINSGYKVISSLNDILNII